MFVERPLFPPFKLRNCWCGCSNTNEMIGQSFPGPGKGADRANNIAKLPNLLGKGD